MCLFTIWISPVLKLPPCDIPWEKRIGLKDFYEVGLRLQPVAMFLDLGEMIICGLSFAVVTLSWSLIMVLLLHPFCW